MCNCKKHSSLSLILLFILALNGCVYTASMNFSPYVDRAALNEYLASRPRKSSEEIKILPTKPKESYIVLGTVSAPDYEWTNRYTTDDLVKAMRKKAVEVGADALVDFRTEEKPWTEATGSVNLYSGGSVSAVRKKGLKAWGEAIIFVTPEMKKILEPQ